MPGLDPRRADLAVAGAVLLDTILRRLGADEITLCDLALREGLVLDYIQRNTRKQIRKVERYPDVRRRSVIELGERCGYWPEHAQQVARLALAHLRPDAQRPRPRAIASASGSSTRALLHDIGVHISYERHHRHSYYLIKNGDLRGFEPRGDRSHRAHRPLSPPGDAEEVARGLRRPRRGRARTVAHAVGDGAAGRGARSQPRAGRRRHRPLPDAATTTSLQLRTTGDAELELWAAHRHVAPLERMLGKPIRFEVAGSDHKERHPC